MPIWYPADRSGDGRFGTLLEGFLKTDAGQEFEFVGPDYFDPEDPWRGRRDRDPQGRARPASGGIQRAIDKIQADGTYQAINEKVPPTRSLRAGFLARRRRAERVPGKGRSGAGLSEATAGSSGKGRRSRCWSACRPSAGRSPRAARRLGQARRQPDRPEHRGAYTTIVRGARARADSARLLRRDDPAARLLSLATGGDVMIDIDPFTAGTPDPWRDLRRVGDRGVPRRLEALDRGQIEAAYAAGDEPDACIPPDHAAAGLRFAIPGLSNVWLVLIKGDRADVGGCSCLN